ncbi:uncharacterized protein LOC106670308 [Cimex lectularius]|uniref:Tetraspanin n=1 Tax=Cimex lectularius TaxID=79782 RepID=A0A8I6S0N6_CIMLE|nr:uncharacterized protein LOC106670308 [Cimex lectularius]
MVEAATVIVYPIKLVLLTFNILCMLFGTILFVFSVIYLIYGNQLTNLISHYLSIICIFCMIGAMIIFIIASVGVVGVLKKSKAHLHIYTTLLVCMAILKIILGITSFVLYPVADKHLNKELARWYNDTPTYKESIKYIQEAFDCCGSFKLEEWAIEKLPKSCCPPKTEVCNRTSAYQTPCYQGIVKTVNNYFIVIGALCFLVLAVEGLCTIFACLIICSFGEEDYRRSTIHIVRDHPPPPLPAA